MTPTDRVFVDTNVLIRANVASAPLHSEARARIEEFQNGGSELWISDQVIREYLVNVTRPQVYAQPLPPQTAVARAKVFSEMFFVATADSKIAERLLDLVARFGVKGKPIHDANIVATMLERKISKLLTHNVDDFQRYESLIELIALK